MQHGCYATRQIFSLNHLSLNSDSSLKILFCSILSVTYFFLFVCFKGLNWGLRSLVSLISTYRWKCPRWTIFNVKNSKMNIQTKTPVFHVIHALVAFITSNANDMTFRWNARICPTVWSNGTLFLERSGMIYKHSEYLRTCTWYSEHSSTPVCGIKIRLV